MPKPWGRTDLGPWSNARAGSGPVGEIWFERPLAPLAIAPLTRARAQTLLLKLLFAAEPLSIQVHPDDDDARSFGQAHGKTEAWYILAADPGARVALGLKRPLLPAQLHASIEDGSIEHLVAWRPVAAGDLVFVPAGTIHAVGAGLVVAEIQQTSDMTFRLFDFGRRRELHATEAVAVADAGPPGAQPVPRRLADGRRLLVGSPYFVLEQFEFRPGSAWELDAERETWLLVLGGAARIGGIEVRIGDALFLDADRAGIAVGPQGLTGLLAYVATEPRTGLLRDLDTWTAVPPFGPFPFDPAPHPPNPASVSADLSETCP